MTNQSYPPRDQVRRLKGLALAGAVVLVCGVVLATPETTWVERIWSNLLVATFYLVTVGLGGTLLVALTYISGGGWQVAFRRVPEAMARIVPLAGIVLLLVLALRMDRYDWVHGGEGDAGTFRFKEYWLTPSFWLIRSAVYIAVWSLLSGWLLLRSQTQDRTGNAAITVGNVRISALFLAVYAVTFSLASADWLMALEPLWFSTMWGVYNFAGMAQAALAVVIILGLVLRMPGRPLCGVFNDEHLHDLGKLLLGFSCFWMYMMIRVAAVVLIGRWVDLYLMVLPSVTSADGERLFPSPVFGVWEIATICCLLGVAGVLLFRSFAVAAPVPERDPYLQESLHYHA